MTWDPPWPPIQVGRDEWIIVRDDKRRAAAVVKRFSGARGTYFRVVTWAEESEGRRLIGRYASLAEADRAVLFRPRESSVRDGKRFATYPAGTSQLGDAARR